nr:sensor domain-containing diguanylate cyclase [Dechloromonas sp.]
MTPSRLRPTLIALLAAALGITVFAVAMLISTQIGRWERRFDDETRLLASEVKNKLDTNEAVLAGFAAFLQAVDRSDTESARRYAAVATAAYPHIYMIEVARRLPVDEENAFTTAMRTAWRPDFTLKSFSELTGRPHSSHEHTKHTWPILFMYPALPESHEIYGLRLETVDYLAHSLALAHQNRKPVVSPVFELYEGGGAYILLQEINRPAQPTAASLNFFGSAMTAMLLIRTQALVPAQFRSGEAQAMQMSASLAAPAKPDSLLFRQAATETGKLDSALLPRFQRQIVIDSTTQPTQLIFERQLRWRELLSADLLTTLLVLAGALILIPWLTIRHYLALDRASLEHERSAYLATHDLLTDLPNRFLFIDRFEQAAQQWQRYGNAFALLLIDLDHFKVVNDRYGHAVGDQVLIVSAHRMKRELRAGDTVARQGGDEFVALIANLLEAEDAVKVGEKLLAAIAEPIETSAGSISLSCSIGIAICPSHGERLDVLLRHADQAMYQAKGSGRNAVSVYLSAGPVDAAR